MTAQASDVILYREREYSLAGFSGYGLFEPEQHGMRPKAWASFCWRGYSCTYAVRDDRLILTELTLGSEQDPPEFGGKRPRRNIINISRVDREARKVVDEPGPAPFVIYDGLSAQIPFTGGLLLGEGFIEELYVHMGFHPAWKFREVHELVFEGGKLLQAKDCSAAAEEFRQRLTKADLSPTGPWNEEQVQGWIAQTFSLRYERG